MDRRSTSVEDKKAVPGLHPGLNDLIRVLGKQAHCASRTVIVCEPVCPRPSYSESKYHKNCASPKKGRSWDSLCRPSSLWSPVRPDSYYYNCFFYRQYPDRDSEYQEIEEKYNAIKQQKLDYSPPECDEDGIKAIDESLNKTGGTRYTGLDDYSRSSAGKGGRGGKGGGISDDWSGPGAFKNRDNLEQSSMGSARKDKYPPGSSGSKKNMVSDVDSVPCAELAEIRDLLKKSDRETIRRMQEMLALMKELSVRDICRATCDGSPPRRKVKTGGGKGAESEEDLYAMSQEPRLEQGIESTKRKGGDVSDYSPQDKKKRYQQSGESDGYGPQGLKNSYKQRDDDYGPQGPDKIYQQKDDYEPQGSLKSYERDDDYGPRGSKKSYQQRDDDYDPQGSLKSYQRMDDGYGPGESKRSYQLGGDSSKRKRGGDDDVYDVELQESETSFQKGKSSKKKRIGADDDRQESIRSSQRWDPAREGKKNVADGEIPAVLNEEEDGYAGSQPDPDIEEPRSLQRHLITPNMARGRLGDDDESLPSTSDSEERSSSTKRERPSSRRGKGKTAVSESDTDQSESSSIRSESSSTDVSPKGKDGESEFESSDAERSEAPETTSSSRGMLKRNQDGSMSSSQASLSVKASEPSVDKIRNEDRSKPGLYQEQKSPKQSALPGSADVRSPDQPGSGANYKIPVGKKNVPLTVHEVVELSNKITDVIVLEIIDELIRHGLYFPPSSRFLQEPGATMPSTSIEGVVKPTSSRQKPSEQGAFDGTRDSSGYKEISREEQMKQTGSPTRLSRIDESSSHPDSKGSSRKDVTTRDESRRSNCPRHSKSLSPSTSSRRRSSSCRLEIERRARSEGDRDKDPTQPRGEIIPPKVPPKPWERRLSSQMKTESMRDSSKMDAQGRSDMPESQGASMSSQMSKASSYKPPSTRPDQASLRDSTMDGSLRGRPPTLPASRQNLKESSPRSTRQYEIPPQDRSDIPGSRRTSPCTVKSTEALRSQMSKTGSYRAPSTRSDQPSLKDGSLPGKQPTLPGSRQNITSGSTRSTKQYEAAGPDKSSMPGSRRASLNSQMSKQSDRNHPPYGAGKTASQQRDIRTDSSLGRTLTQDPSGSGKVSSGPRIPNENSKPHGILKDSSPTSSLRGNQIEDVHGPAKAPIVCQDPKKRSHEDVFGAGRVPNAQQIPTAKHQPDKTSSGQRIIEQNASNVLMGEEELTKGSVDKIIRPDNVDDSVQNGAGAMPRTSQGSPVDIEPCEPDDFIATNYDTDNSVLYYARITNNAFPPVKETYHAAGFILRSAYNYDIPARSKMSVKTDLLLQLPRNSYGRIAPRKCLVENYGIDVVADVIDRDYKGNITVVLFNHGDRTFTIERGNKIAQLICESIHLAKVVENADLLK